MTEAVMNSLKETAIEKDDESGVFQKYNELLHIGYRPASRRRKANEVEILSIPFLKKYIYYAKNRIKPILSAEACDYISNRYAELRNKADGQDDQYRTMPITPRTLETLIRLSTAHAKLRLSRVVDIVDTEVAFEILVYALFKELKPKKRAGKKVKTADSSSDEDEGESIRESVVSQPSTARLSAVTGASSRIESLVGHMNIDDDTSTVAASSNVRELAEPGQALAGSE